MRKAEFLKAVEEFLTETGMSATAFGIQAKEEPGFVFSLRKGRECREEVKERVLAFMAKRRKAE